jgi:23S rRNA (uracil1939-C5)-methyltransferase
VRIGGFAQVLSARAFAQANARVTGDILALIGAVADDVAREGGGKRALELFAGSGTLTQALWSRGWEVDAYELDAAARPAFEAARATLGGRGAWHACDLASGLVRPPPRDPEGIDLVLLDPPRTGAAAVVPWLRASRARSIIYVSCDIATGLRDLATLSGDGRWRIDRVVGFDMFPHTGHQEMVSVARRK